MYQLKSVISRESDLVKIATLRNWVFVVRCAKFDS